MMEMVENLRQTFPVENQCIVFCPWANTYTIIWIYIYIFTFNTILYEESAEIKKENNSRKVEKYSCRLTNHTFYMWVIL